MKLAIASQISATNLKGEDQVEERIHPISVTGCHTIPNDLIPKSVLECRLPTLIKENLATSATTRNNENLVDSNLSEEEEDFNKSFEENWRGINPNSNSQTVFNEPEKKIKFHVKLPKSRRSQNSILNPRNVTYCQRIPVLQNGYTSRYQSKQLCQLILVDSTVSFQFSFAFISMNRNSEKLLIAVVLNSL